MRKELVSKPLALAGTLDKPRNVNEIDSGGDDLRGLLLERKLVKALVGDWDDAVVGVNCAERIVCRLRLAIGEGVEESRLPDIGKTDEST